MKSEKITKSTVAGRVEYRDRHGRWHREDGPAVEWPNGELGYYFHGQLHRDGGPAREYPNGTKEWWHYGLVIKIITTDSDGSTSIYENNLCKKNKDGHVHCENGPAEVTFGVISYARNGQYHREDGPARIHLNGEMEWYIDGERHREDGPAYISGNGIEIWYSHGKRHKLDGPACVATGGHQEWWVEDKLHREDGPAVIRSNGSEDWYINGKKHRLDGPATIDEAGSKAWYFDGELHRNGAPAVEFFNGAKAWYSHGKKDRRDGPAVILEDGTEEYYVDGRKVSEEEYKEMSWRHKVYYPLTSDEHTEWLDWEGKRHRQDGPAYEDAKGNKLWSIHGKQVERGDSIWPNLLKTALAVSATACLSMLADAPKDETIQELEEELEEMTAVAKSEVVLA